MSFRQGHRAAGRGAGCCAAAGPNIAASTGRTAGSANPNLIPTQAARTVDDHLYGCAVRSLRELTCRGGPVFGRPRAGANRDTDDTEWLASEIGTKQ
jgi:hypothetical protein